MTHTEFTLDHTRVLLEMIVADPQLEAEWLQMLSQLEYVGCRKIVKSISFEAVSLFNLRHMMEEATHAFVLRRLAEKRLSEVTRARSWAKNPFAESGWRYFQTLDRTISAFPKEEGLSDYEAVSWGIEQRVLRLYPLYAETTQDPEVRRALRMILAQEQNHGTEFEETLKAQSHELRGRIVAVETRLWERLVTELIGLCEPVPQLSQEASA